MWMRLRSLATAVMTACAIGCGQGTRPAASVLPTPTAPTGSGPVASARVVGTLTDRPVGGASVTGASVRSTVSGGDGVVTLEASAPGRYAVSVAAAQFVTRQTAISIPGGEGRVDLISSGF